MGVVPICGEAVGVFYSPSRLDKQFKYQTVLFQTIQFNISTQFKCQKQTGSP